MKKNIDYYPHKTEAHRHPKFKMLRSMFESQEQGWAAEGRFWALNNLIASSEDCKLDLQKKRNKGVFADELGMSIGEFEQFVEILVSEDVELLVQIEPNVYTTDTVQETYESIASERKRAKDKYEKSKKDVNVTTSEEKTNFSTEKSETSGEARHKVNKSEVKGKELNKKKVNESGDPTFLKFSSSLKKLFEDHTKIKDPNKSTHLNPILQFYEKIPEVMTDVDISNCIQSAFKSLDPGKGVRIDFLCDGIQQRITAEHERIVTEAKQAEHEEARKDRAEQNKAESKKNAEEVKEQQKKCIAFWGENRKKFKTEENLEIKRHVTSGNYYAAAKLINSKMDEFELI